MIVDQSNQNSVEKNRGEKNSWMRRPSSIASGVSDEPREVEAVAQAQAEMRAVHDVAVAIDDVRPVMERVALIEGEEFVFDGNSRIACGGDRLRAGRMCSGIPSQRRNRAGCSRSVALPPRKNPPPIRSSAS